MTALLPDDFLKRFFSQPNRLWHNMESDNPVAATMVPFLAALPKLGERPLILPCRRTDPSEPTAVYVVCWDTAHAGRIRALLEAAVAHHWCRFDGRVVRLDSLDPVEASILDFVGPGTTFLLRPTQQSAAPTLTALRRLVSTIGDVPLRVSRAPRPIGRMLREFDLALATGAVESSASLLREIETNGGVSHENVAFLQIRRLARLGRDHELLAHGSLPTLVYVDPPRLVREGVLAAWARVNLARPIRADDIDVALGAIREADPDVAMLVDDTLARTDDADTSTVCALVAILRQDASLAANLATNPTIDSSVLERLTLTEDSPPIDETQAPDTSAIEGPSQPVTPAPPAVTLDTWLDWVSLLGTAEAMPLETGQALTWLPAWRVDRDLADAIDALPELATDDLLSGVAALLDSDDLDHPAPFTAAALVSRYLVAGRFSPYDLGAIAALLGIFLRSGPPPDAYREVLNDIRGFAHQWVSVATATRAIDLADVVACGPATDSATRGDFVAALLAPLNQQKRRLPASLRQLSGLVTEDVALDYDWAVPDTDLALLSTGRPASSHRILLYSLDSGTLARVEKAISLEWPNLRVEISSDKDGNPALKQHARNADLIVVATRRATHAATGFIADNGGGALIRYPDGAGSASMLRAVESGIAELLG